MIYPFPAGGFLGRGLKYDPAEPVMSGNDVIGWQYHLSVKADGVFGPRTAEATEAFQRTMGLDADGIAGPASMKAACLQRIAASDSGTPPGLMKGMVEGESSYWVGAQSAVYFVKGIRKADLGAFQFQTTLSDEEAVRRALNLPEGADRLGAWLIEGYDTYRPAAYVRRHRTPEKLAWWLACGRWNAPAWTDIWAARGPNDPALQVVVEHPFFGFITREEWVRRYVASKIIYVTAWSA